MCTVSVICDMCGVYDMITARDMSSDWSDLQLIRENWNYNFHVSQSLLMSRMNGKFYICSKFSNVAFLWYVTIRCSFLRYVRVENRNKAETLANCLNYA